MKLSQCIGKMLKEYSEDTIYQNKFFILGLKLLAKHFLNFYIIQQKPSED